MATEWLHYCRAKDLEVDEPHIDVSFRDDRRHRVTVEEGDDMYHLIALVARQMVVSSQENLAIQLWLRNRESSLVGFRIDRRQRLVGESWVPKAGLTAEEFQLYVRTVAIECDRFEYMLTGRDVE